MVLLQMIERRRQASKAAIIQMVRLERAPPLPEAGTRVGPSGRRPTLSAWSIRPESTAGTRLREPVLGHTAQGHAG